jgi:GNAT superfamily N-acetyltransferase
MRVKQWRRDEYRITTDPARADLDATHAYLTQSYWCAGITKATVRRAIDGSIPFSLFAGDRLAAFCRVISDGATIAYLGDVFVLPEFRGRGLSKWMMECVVAHPDLQGLRRWILLTRDAHGLYEKIGFTSLHNPGIWMERWDPDVYRR